ncbi:hypothetical protein Hte_012238 [Hypoxylon texense]
MSSSAGISSESSLPPGSQTQPPFPVSNSTVSSGLTAPTSQPASTGSESAFGSTSSLSASETESPFSTPSSVPFSSPSASSSAGQPTVLSSQATSQAATSLSTGPLSSVPFPLSNSTAFSNSATGTPSGPSETSTPLPTASGTTASPVTPSESSSQSPTGSSISSNSTAVSTATTSMTTNQSSSVSLSITSSSTASSPRLNSTISAGPSASVPLSSGASTTEPTQGGQSIPPEATTSSVSGLSTSAPYTDTCTEEPPTTYVPDTTCTESETPFITIDTTCSESTITQSGSVTVTTLTFSSTLITSSAHGYPSPPFPTTKESVSPLGASTNTEISAANATSFGGGDAPTTFRTSTTIPGEPFNSTSIGVETTSNIGSPDSSPSTAGLTTPMPDRDHWHTPPVVPTPSILAGRGTTRGGAGSGWHQYVRNLFTNGDGEKEEVNQGRDGKE